MASSFWTERPVPLWLNAPTDAVEVSRDKSRLGRTASLGGKPVSDKFLIEAFGFETAAEITAAWSDLIDRSLEPNVFMEPGFALPAAQHLARADRPTFVAVWELDSARTRGRLLGLWTLILPGGVFRSHVARLWCHKQAALGLPLLDATHADQVLAAFFVWLESAFPRLRLLLFPKLVRSGPTFARVLGHALEAGLEWRLLEQYRRAVLSANSDVSLSKEYRRRLQRQHRQLERHGVVGVHSACNAADIRDATEAFLALEESGWKGSRRTALLSDSSRAAFARTMTRRLAQEGKCRIDAITVGDRPVAMQIVLRSRDRAFLWKSAYDEAFARQSPGVQIALEVTRIQQADKTCSLTDSCALADSPMIDRLWCDRLPIADMAVALFPGANDMLAGFARRDALLRGLRRWAGNCVRAARRETRA